MNNRHLADEVVSLPQPVEIAQGVERQNTIARIFDCIPIHTGEPRLRVRAIKRGGLLDIYAGRRSEFVNGGTDITKCLARKG